MYKSYVEVAESEERYASCNCCPSTEETPKLWDIRFVFGNHTTLIKMCEKHLKGLRNEIDKTF
jgi:hypothetical protein